ncbi:MAG: AtpZ/AtpI family protein [Pseudomonadota bacterium]
MSDDDQERRSELDALGQRIAKARGEDDKAQIASRSSGAAAGDGLRIAIEFVVSVLVGTGLGYAIGAYFGAPLLGLLIGLPFGFAAGLRTVYRGMTAAENKDGPNGDD